MAQKLYTEEQVNKAMLDYIQGIPRVDIIKSLPPIELPSDEEINERSYYDKYNDKLIVNAAEIARFRDGAKWLKQQILNQNKKD